MTGWRTTLTCLIALLAALAVRADDSAKPAVTDTSDADLVRDLLGESESEESDADPAKALEKAVESMERAGRRLGDERDSGEATRKHQEDAITSLDQLIELAKKQRPSGSRPGSPSPMDNEGEKPMDEPMDEPGEGSSSAGESGGERRPDDENATESADVTAPADASEAALAERRRLVKDVWGHLPPTVREELMNAYNDRALPKYESLVRAYYRALAEKSSRPE